MDEPICKMCCREYYLECGDEPTDFCHSCAQVIAPILLEAVKACMDYIPGSEVRSWPPGFKLKDKAIRKAEGKS